MSALFSNPPWNDRIWNKHLECNENMLLMLFAFIFEASLQSIVEIEDNIASYKRHMLWITTVRFDVDKWMLILVLIGAILNMS